MRLVLDTNVLIAAFVARGQCNDLLEHCVREHVLVTSQFILDEFLETLRAKLGFSSRDAREAARLLRARMRVVAPSPLGKQVCRDPDDDWVLATAIAGACACIVTGDKDLLALKRYRDVSILRPADFWVHEARGHLA